MYLPGCLQNSHRNGGHVFLIFVADPRTTRLFRKFSRDDDRDTGRGRSVASLGMLMPTRCTGLCTQLGNTTAEVGSGPDTLSECRIRAPKFTWCTQPETYVA